MSDKHRTLIDVYDHDGDLVERLDKDLDAVGLTELMVDCLKNEGIPIVRDVDKVLRGKSAPMMPDEVDSGEMLNHQKFNRAFAKPIWEYVPPTAQPILMKLEMKVEMKVDQQTLVCEGFGMDVLKAQERFLHAIMPGFDGE